VRGNSRVVLEPINKAISNDVSGAAMVAAALGWILYLCGPGPIPISRHIEQDSDVARVGSKFDGDRKGCVLETLRLARAGAS
jgi:hypothetical protein